jgi:hypothetical protein
MEHSELEELLCQCLQELPRGTCALIAQKTALTETELSFFRNEDRRLIADKLVMLANFLLQQGMLTYTLVVKEIK